MIAYKVTFRVKNSGLKYCYTLDNNYDEFIDAKDLSSAKKKIANKYLKRVNTQRKYNNKNELKKLNIEILRYSVIGYY